ncbi:xylulokinase [Yoonia sediminilitoris]|uniref:Xylulose kinase n=1 Tax=Yoonia sediminilitoris TaxID=1286148 RepID=A0A2T6KMQ0_9RHOB|nr:xylulokinase [Yoonia sediminilitoris]PUB17500.1 xylulokinase [Yoonia sediminilitoris]RCW97795.1 xylulokinase [Yoonia sediminilitoris]
MYLGLDLGTSGLKTILTDETGRVIETVEGHYPNPHPRQGWSEQDPADWITACETAFDTLAARVPAELADLRGIGISGHMHGATLIDAADQVLRPCILWNDTRSARQAAWLDQQPDMHRITGNIVFPGFTAPKLLWLEENEPDVFAKVAKVLLPKDYLRLWLTGGHMGDMSDSAGTSWLDVGAREWSDQALATGHMRRDQMPDLCEGSAVSGQMRDALRQRWGIKAPVIVAGGAGDNAAAACGAGCFSEGQGFVSLGTSGVLLAAKDRYAPDAASAVHTFCHAVPDRWYQMGVILAATDCLNWLSRNLGQSAAELAGGLPGQISGPSDLMFLPYLSGERTPHNNADVRGAFIGLDVAHGPADLTQAVVEGVTFALRDCLKALEGTGTKLESVIAMGGGARSRFWLQTLATTLNLPLQIPAGGEFGAALGAARLGIAAQTGAHLTDIMTLPDIGETIDPRPDLTDAYDARWQRYRGVYDAVNPDR